MGYQILLALHIISIICWMAGVLYLFRLFIYHRIETESVVKSRFEVMEKRLFRIITLPASTLALVFGIWMLVLNPGLMSQGWMHAKLVFAIALLGLTHSSAGIMRKLKQGTYTKSEKYLRILNEVPTLLMIIIVFLVILRPF